MSIYYKYALDGSKIVVLSYVDDCVYWYTNEDLVKWFVDTLGKRLHVHIPRSSHGISFPRYQQTIFQDLHLYTNSQNNQYKIKQQFYIHQVHTCDR